MARLAWALRSCMSRAASALNGRLQAGCGILQGPLLVPLAIPLSRGSGPLFRQVYAHLREAILSGALRSGERLPSTRTLAEQLGISRTVVLLAYDHLLAEGFVAGPRGSGTFVSSGIRGNRSEQRSHSIEVRLSRFGSSASAAWPRVNYPERPERSLAYDFAYGLSDLEDFPFEMWRRILLRCARRAPISELDYGHGGANTRLAE